MKYDVAIVGTGPAGGAAALKLSDSGLKIALIEKERLPRHKPCGGAMPATSLELLNISECSCIVNRVGLVQYMNNYKDTHLVKLPREKQILLVNRSDFDHFLVKKALAGKVNNISFMQCSNVTDIKEMDDKVVLTINDKSHVEAEYVVAADGAFSKIARSVGLMKNRKFASALDAEIRTTQSFYYAHSKMMAMNLFCIPDGYGWIFPKENRRFSCGVGSSTTSLNLKIELDAYLKRIFPENSIETIDISGHLIPIFKGTEQIVTDRIFLTGDAAALVCPVSGGGIRFALLSGKIAAELIKDKFKSATDKSEIKLSERYQAAIDERIGKNLKRTLSFASLAFKSNPDFFYKNYIKA